MDIEHIADCRSIDTLKRSGTPLFPKQNGSEKRSGMPIIRARNMDGDLLPAMNLVMFRQTLERFIVASRLVSEMET